MRQILDLHIHSKYSRACSRDLDLPNIARVCAILGIDIVATGDFTHPLWFKHIKESLEECQEGVYKLKEKFLCPEGIDELKEKPFLDPSFQGGGRGKSIKFILGTELSCIKKHKDKTRRIHVCIYAPNIKVVEKFNQKLESLGFNLKSDGRPILGLTVKELLTIMLGVDSRMQMIPAHAWTPWFAIFGSKGGYDSLDEAFEELTPHIHAIETGLSSDPAMNWRLSKLDNITLISNSDAHSTSKLGREANVFEFENEKEITYTEIFRIINEGDRKKFKYTIEFYPEEGKYHADGCANCHFSCTPVETKRLKGICPKCKRKFTVGVLSRIEELADRNGKEIKEITNKISYKSLVPLPEIIADVFSCGVNTKKVKVVYDNLIENLGAEFDILLDVSLNDIEKFSNADIAGAVKRVRAGNIYVVPGYDGIFGTVKVFTNNNNTIKQTKLGI